MDEDTSNKTPNDDTSIDVEPYEAEFVVPAENVSDRNNAGTSSMAAPVLQTDGGLSKQAEKTRRNSEVRTSPSEQEPQRESAASRRGAEKEAKRQSRHATRINTHQEQEQGGARRGSQKEAKRQNRHPIPKPAHVAEFRHPEASTRFREKNAKRRDQVSIAARVSQASYATKNDHLIRERSNLGHAVGRESMSEESEHDSIDNRSADDNLDPNRPEYQTTCSRDDESAILESENSTTQRAEQENNISESHSPPDSEPSQISVVSDSELVVANPVADNDCLPTDLPEATQLDEEAKAKEQMEQKRLALRRAATFFFGGLGILVVLMVLLPKRNDGKEDMVFANSTGNATIQVPEWTISDHFFSLLPKYTVERIQQPESAQARAFDWILADPNLENYTDSRLLQRFALATFYYATGGSEWYNNEYWLDHNVHECYWYPATFLVGAYENDTVHPILNSAGPCGWAGIMDGPNATYQKEAFARDETFQHFAMRNNRLQGSVPDEIFSLLPNLKSLFLSNTGITGSLPTTIGLATNLSLIFMESNELTGSLPVEIGALTNMMNIVLMSNKLSGAIPTELGRHTAMNRLVLEGNQFIGTIPSEFGLLSSATVLFLNGNFLTGAIPTEVGNMVGAQHIKFSENLLTGTLPSQLGSMTSLLASVLHSNFLNGSIPTELGQISLLIELFIRDNQLTGEIPSELGLLTQMAHFSASSTPLAPAGRQGGPVSEKYDVEEESLFLSGILPSELGMWHNLNFFDISGHNIRGAIPSELCKASSLQVLNMGDNLLSGSLPTEIGHLPFITDLGIYMNEALSGPLPSEMANMRNLSTFVAALTDLTGTIPSELGLLEQTLQVFAIQNTSITGTLPDDMCTVPNLFFDCLNALCGCTCECQ